ncbi:MAG: hypothetical protein IKE73_02250, partial [Bacilli bacterium]|nr:hypothetical protein [Bacilli bacterium]
MKKKMKKVLVILLAITLLTGGIFGVRTFANKLPSYKKSISKLFSRFYGDGSDTNTTVLRSDGMVHYSDSTSGDATEYWESNLFYTENSTSDTYNAYCIFPRGTSAGRKNQSVTGQNVTDVEAFQYIKKMLYYGYGGPGWNTTINANPDTNGFKYFYNEVCGVTYFKPDPNQPSSCETDNGESYYLITHLMLSSIAHYSNIPSAYGSQPEFSDIFYGTHVSMQTWLGARSQEFTMSGKIHSTNTPDVNDPDFKVWYIKGTATPDSFGIQNILYWTDTEEVPSTYCTKAKKVDSEGHEISGATFGLYSDSSCNNLVTSKSGSSVTFDGLEDDGPYFIEETIAPDGYSRNRGCYQADVVEENGSSCSADPVEIENGPLYLSFYKENENGDPFTSASFKVKNASGTYITVSARNSNYNNCYVYTGTSSEGTTMNPDSNGRICIVKIPDGTYSAHEQSTGNEGYYFENGTISNLRPGTDVRGKEDANSLKNKPFVLNFYKETENSAKVDGAKFEITYNNSKIGYSGTENYTDTNGATKKCYIYSSASDSTKTFISGENGNVGEVCIVRIPGNKDYTIKETDPVKYHTFGSSNSKTFSPSKYYAAKISGNTFVNYPTEFEFTKNVGRTKGKGISVEGSETITVNGQSVTLDSLTLSELKNLVFNITASGSSTNLSFIKTGDGVYEYAQDPNMDRPNGEITTNLKVGSNKKIKVLHLPEGTYEIKENNGGTCESATDYTKCIGYYDQNTVQRFTITDCSSPNATSCTSSGTVTASMTNIPTEITFTKSDLYSYVDEGDTVKFENEEELRAFDDIVFKLFTYDENNNKVYLTLKHIGNSGVCTSENSYSIYRYVAGDNSDGAGGTELHTCGGHIVITNLCRGKKYYIEEVSVPGYSVFTLPENESDRIKEYTIPCTEGEAEQSTTTTAIINDTPTRVIFQKRDSKYGYLIPDETTTFKVYRCKKNTECHPSENDSNAVLVK